MTTCKYTFKLNAYHDGELLLADRQKFERHLPGCPECRSELAALAGISALASPLRQVSIPSHLLSKLRSIPTRASFGELLPTARFLLAISAFLLIASVAFSHSKTQPPSAVPQGWEVTASRNAEPEIVDEPEAEITSWVVAGLTERLGP